MAYPETTESINSHPMLLDGGSGVAQVVIPIDLMYVERLERGHNLGVGTHTGYDRAEVYVVLRSGSDKADLVYSFACSLDPRGDTGPVVSLD